ncbi:MAG TPA: hypothetical protein VE684_09895 [Crenalkalicoccus sp.]|nr:hypothetical protein [Crenalkalicoccus sp.]
MKARLAALDPFEADYEVESARLVGHVHPVQPDAEGRASLPRDLLEKVELGAEIAFAGRFKLFTIWNAAVLAEREAAGPRGRAA